MEEEYLKEKYISNATTTQGKKEKAHTQSAMVIIDHKTGYVLATVGSIGEKTAVFGWNRATDALRSPGSTIKPLAVVSPGIDKGIITAATVFDDISYSSGPYQGFKNYGYAYKGLITVRYAIEFRHQWTF